MLREITRSLRGGYWIGIPHQIKIFYRANGLHSRLLDILSSRWAVYANSWEDTQNLNSRCLSSKSVLRRSPWRCASKWWCEYFHSSSDNENHWAWSSPLSLKNTTPEILERLREATDAKTWERHAKDCSIRLQQRLPRRSWSKSRCKNRYERTSRWRGSRFQILSETEWWTDVSPLKHLLDGHDGPNGPFTHKLIEWTDTAHVLNKKSSE